MCGGGVQPYHRTKAGGYGRFAPLRAYHNRTGSVPGVPDGVGAPERECVGTTDRGGYTYPPNYPSTRQGLGKMGIFFKIIRQKSVREPSGIRQAPLKLISDS